MVTEAPRPARRRRHGQELESARLVAPWDEVVETGYARLTMESVAKRAGTSEPVLYRRWPNKDQLVLAAMEHYRKANPIDLPDPGSLRSDLLAELTLVSEARAGVYAIAAAASFSGLRADTGLTPAQVREKVMGEPLPAVRPIYQRAHDPAPRGGWGEGLGGAAPGGPAHLPARPRPWRDRPRACPPGRAGDAVR